VSCFIEPYGNLSHLHDLPARPIVFSTMFRTALEAEQEETARHSMFIVDGVFRDWIVYRSASGGGGQISTMGFRDTVARTVCT
jgi:hypothetical protein